MKNRFKYGLIIVGVIVSLTTVGCDKTSEKQIVERKNTTLKEESPSETLKDADNTNVETVETPPKESTEKTMVESKGYIEQRIEEGYTEIKSGKFTEMLDILENEYNSKITLLMDDEGSYIINIKPYKEVGKNYIAISENIVNYIIYGEEDFSGVITLDGDEDIICGMVVTKGSYNRVMQPIPRINDHYLSENFTNVLDEYNKSELLKSLDSLYK